MMWLIAILLLLILVALISSDRAAAKGVKKFLTVTGLVAYFLLLWGLFLGYAIWFNTEFKSGDVQNFLVLVIGFLLPPIVYWGNYRDFVNAFEDDKAGTIILIIKQTLKVVAFLAFVAIGNKLWTDNKAAGLLLAGVIMVCTAAILLVRTIANPSNWEVIWTGTSEATKPENVAYKEYLEKKNALNAHYLDRLEAVRHPDFDGDPNEESRLYEERPLKLAELDHQLEMRVRELQIQQGNDGWRPIFTVRFAFFMSAIVVLVNALGSLWDPLFNFAMTMDMVNGIVWRANVAVVILYGLGLSAIVQAWDYLKMKRSLK